MSIEQLKIAIAEKERQMSFLSNEIAELRRQLIKAAAESSEFKIGDRVIVTNGKAIEFGIFGGYVSKYGNVEPLVFKMKKDGTASAYKLWIYHNTKIEKA